MFLRFVTWSRSTACNLQNHCPVETVHPLWQVRCLLMAVFSAIYIKYCFHNTNQY